MTEQTVDDQEKQPESQLGLFGDDPEPESEPAVELESEPDPASVAAEEPPESEPAPVESAPPPVPAQAPTPTPKATAPAPAAPPEPMPDIGPDDLLAGIAGQPAATKMLQASLKTPVPAYFFVGPAGAGIREAACRFAGELLAQDSDMPATQRRLALEQQHPDLIIYDRVGPSLTAEQARDAVRQAAKSPVYGRHKVLVICDLHLALTTASILLKAVEEPSPSTTFILLAEQISPHLQTLNSRSVRIDFVPLNEAAIAEILRTEGVAEQRLELAARASGGSIDRARLLSSDNAALERIDLWRSVLERLDGSGASAAAITEEVLAAIDAATEPLKEKHEAELEQQKERAEMYSLEGASAGSASTRDRQKRELRRLTTDELLMGFGVLTEEIRQRAMSGAGSDAPSGAPSEAHSAATAATAATRLATLRSTADLLMYNINTRLALQNLMLQIGG